MAELSRTTRAEQRAPAFAFLGEEVTYRQRSSSTNNKTGTVTYSNTDTTVTALISELDELTVRNSGGKYQVGDRRFRIQASEMPETPPAKSTSVMVDGSSVFLIIDYVHSSDRAVWDLICRLP